MTRHQRNATASSVYTYHERKKDQKASGYGSLRERLSKDSIRNFDCCCLTLQPCRDPVITPDGFLYDKEAILEYILHRKREIARQLKEYDRQRKKEERELEELSKAAKEAEAKRFIAQESTPARPNLADDDLALNTTQTSSPSISNMSGEKQKHLPSFWIPAMLSSAKDAKIEKPDSKMCCPMSGRPLKMKDLLPVRFTLADAEKANSSVFGKDRYVCAVTKDVLTNATPLAVLKKSGCVVTSDCVEHIIKKDWIDPVVNAPMTESDIIYIQRGGTGFSSTNEKLEAKLARPVMELQ